MSVIESKPTDLNIRPQSPKVESSSMQYNPIIVKLEAIESVEEPKEAIPKVNWPLKRKVNKKKQKVRFNARMRRLVCPKSPLMVFYELYRHVPIKLETQIRDNSKICIASIKLDGQLYTGKDVSKTQAKEKACEKFLRQILSKEIYEQTSSSEEVASTAENSLEVGVTGKTNSVNESPQKVFPWLQFGSLAMYNLLCNWNLHSAPKKMSAFKSRKQFPTDPENYHPVELLHQMSPEIKFNEITIINGRFGIYFEASCEFDGVTFKAQGRSKKEAKKGTAIAVIKHVWGFDYHSTETE